MWINSVWWLLTISLCGCNLIYLTTHWQIDIYFVFWIGFGFFGHYILIVIWRSLKQTSRVGFKFILKVEGTLGRDWESEMGKGKQPMGWCCIQIHVLVHSLNLIPLEKSQSQYRKCTSEFFYPRVRELGYLDQFTPVIGCRLFPVSVGSQYFVNVAKWAPATISGNKMCVLSVGRQTSGQWCGKVSRHSGYCCRSATILDIHIFICSTLISVE